MFAPYRSNAVAYRQMGVETALTDATPHKLILMLFEGADEHLRKAAAAMGRGDHAAKGEAITRVIRILDEGLRSCLDDRAGEIAENLRALYTYMVERLLIASARNDAGIVAEVQGLLDQVASAWREISPGRSSAPDARSSGADPVAPSSPAARAQARPTAALRTTGGGR